MTLLSRISGLIRDVVFAHILGDRAAADVFFVALRIPNFFRRLFGEGAFSVAFVPVFTDYRLQRSQNDQRQFLSLILGRFSLLLAVVCLFGVLFMPVIVSMLAPGFVADADKYDLAVNASRISFSYLFFISLVAMSAAMLNTCGRFAAPAATPILLNICLIAAALWLTPWIETVMALAIGVLIAGVVQLLFQIPFLRREHLFVKPRLRIKGKDDAGRDGIVRVFRLTLPALLGVSVAQINMLVNTLLASFMATGSIAWLYYSDRLMEFPVGVFGIALSTSILPNLSAKYIQRSDEAFSYTLDWALRLVVIVALPATVGLVLLSIPLIATIFYHGGYTDHGVQMTAYALIAYALGLLPIIMVKVLAPGYYARQNTKTPVRIAVVSILVNIIFSLILFMPMQHIGLALATSIAALVNATLLLRGLRREGVYRPEPGWMRFIVQVISAAVIMGCLLWLGVEGDWLLIGVMERIIRLMIWVAAGGVTYVVFLGLFGIRPAVLWMDKEKEQS